MALGGCWSPQSALSGLSGQGWVSLMYGKSLTRAVLLLGIQLTALWPIAAVEIYTSGVLEAVNGTDVRLKCTFSSFAPVGDALTVTWNFRPQDGGSEQFVFYYHVDPFKPMSGRFKDRVVWDGNPERYDVSIILWKLQFDDNGTYTCQVKNPPDVDGLVGEIRLSVVQTVRFSEMYFLALAIGSACALMVIIVIVVVLFQHFRKKRWAERAHKVVEIKSKEEERLDQEKKVAVYLEDAD
ncbi:myelin protein zero-like protein 2 [Pteronotus mesoamericanus]|uniref:myelin protein zero-like protein 2 n=1 Tax=Pteronotus mesoamericanus TaxID=1884717 RepID=UPI0023EB236B|nr:myelin protein zero-like protein 2 [Pteronotus parnellii mesoamericanus]XP_054448549.1 myelin protein zero-like protein 2 [Pteronotus parnellii mesoamericanus]